MSHIDSFSGLASNIKPKERNLVTLMHALSKSPLVSTWDMSEERWLRNLINDALMKEMIVEIECNYPWHKYELTEKGTEFLGNKG